MNLVLIGVGSRAARDDAIGLHLVESVAAQAPAPTLTPLLWEDADALTLACELLELGQPVLIVDCADMRLEPGAWRLIHPKQDRLRLAWDSVSTHGLGIAEALEIAESLGFSHVVHLFGVQPFDLTPGRELTPEMRMRLPQLSIALREIVTRLLAGASPIPSERAPLLE